MEQSFMVGSSAGSGPENSSIGNQEATVIGLVQSLSTPLPAKTLQYRNIDPVGCGASLMNDSLLSMVKSTVKVKEEVSENKDVILELVSYPSSSSDVPLKYEDDVLDERIQEAPVSSNKQKASRGNPSNVTTEDVPNIANFESDLNFFNQSNIVNNIEVKVKEECSHEEVITSELVKYSSADSNETFKSEDDSFEEEPYFPLDDSPAQEKGSEKNCCKDQVRSKASVSKLRDVSVKLVDIFPNSVRKLGKAHYQDKSCACIFCRGEYKWTAGLPYLPKDIGRLSRVAPHESALKSGQDSTDSSVLSNKVLFECSECSKKFTLKNSLSKHLKENCKVVKSKEGYTAKYRKKRGKKNYICTECSRDCKSNSELLNHMRVHTKERPFSCKVCSKSYTQKSAVNAHIRRVHLKLKPINATCSLCPKKFNSQCQLAMHVRAVHLQEKPYSCKLCPAKFAYSARSLKVHIQSVHRKEKPYVCSLCSASFSQNSHLGVHMRAIHLNQKFSCELCPAKLAQKSELRRHYKAVHLKEKPYECSDCAKTFPFKSALESHKDSVHNPNRERNFSCEICSAAFITKEGLHLHLRSIHSDERPFTCDICQATFKRKFTMKAHIRSHDPEKRFSCDVCFVKLKSKRSLEYHLQSHRGERQCFTCHICSLEFSSKSYVKLHLKAVHENKRMFSCKLCPAKFKQNQHLNIHLQGVHLKGKTFNCAHCQAKFRIRQSLNLHIKAKHLAPSYICDYCSAKFALKGGLKLHIRVVHLKEKLFSCHLCPAKFSQGSNLRSHVRRIHLEDKPFSCNVCTIKYQYKQDLKKHMLSHSERTEDSVGGELHS